LLQAVDEAVSVHLIEDVPGQMDGYQFAHALIQQTLAGEVTTSRRVRLHARIAEALEALYGDDAEYHAAELAHHFAESQTSTGITKLARYSLVAGERALAAHAYEDALTYFERGLIARDIGLSGTEAAPDEEAADLLFGLAQAQSATVGYIREAFATLSRAFDYYAEAGNIVQAVAAAEFPIAPPLNPMPGLAQLISRALSLVPADSHEAGRLLSRYGGVLAGAEADYEGAQQALDQAATIARRVGDVRLETRTLAYACAASAHHLHWQESVNNGLRAIELAAGEENSYPEYLSRFWTLVSLILMGDLDGARPHALVLRDLADRRSTPRQQSFSILMLLTSLSIVEGDWKAAREYSDRSLELVPLSPELLTPRALLEHETGGSAQGQVYLERLLELRRRAGEKGGRPAGMTSIAIARIARITGDPDLLEVAEAAAEELLSDCSGNPYIAMSAKHSLSLVAVQKGDRSAAEEHYGYLLGQLGAMSMAGPLDRILGLLSQTMGNLDQAADHFEEALASCGKAGYRPDLAWTCCDYADLLLRRDGHGDRAKAITLLEESLAISSELGMRPLMERATERLERAQSAPVRVPAYPDGLTQREVEVLRSLASGKSNLEIAEELFISLNTVARHLTNIFGKIGATNRVEAANYASRHGLSR